MGEAVMNTKRESYEMTRLRYLEKAHRRISEETEELMREMKAKAHAKARDVQRLMQHMKERHVGDADTWKRIECLLDELLHL